MPNTTTNWLLQYDHPVPTPRVPPAVEYHRVYAGEKRRILRGVLAIVLLFVGLVGFAQLFLFGAAIIDSQMLGRTGFTPLQQAAGALSLGVLIPYSMLLQRLLYGVPFRSLHSVAGRFRFGVFGRAMLAFGPILLVVVASGFLLAPAEQVPWTTFDLVAYFVIGMLLTPLAAAGEEYGFRGFMFRVVGGWTRGTRVGAAIGIIIPTVLFSLFHGSLDPYILTSYLVLFGSLAVVTWRTGGLETAVVLHVVYNVTALVLGTTLHVDLGGALNSREAASGSFATLMPSATLILITAVVWWMTRGTGPARTPER
ncbi:CPBP family intramembrane metalloprotease domain-containing protein [Pseudoclavibacter sp. RFBJ3]|uniref:CPBP family intramembrane glutamic endopeptidase n=1 Tax=unclassified Pseudoclavibacter TaxID=2615177 RepID=UPI000CE8728C|nr:MULTISPECIES: type II CAAX endopeptidase family protein [unclassified Pseudoclavibacter]PPF87229.1 CPBP family intramembrane metalloprotease domain-containing protein [Pseudoclavibacter sp. RFBJ5]PPF89452.1 CPBP family intramembrane metalloprotease domain-containing protein [Pseudoclavibacter sp. RFBJ3]PPG00743.1 CPBP family intramembrane metalloprotease domain-containing protein [Pseudoclavibacter sp. RFBH5]PPG18851.1 CPBP family intramembrane metalloprotease domain-containing protein [Pseu